MNTNEFIKLLKQLDPKGEKQVVVDNPYQPWLPYELDVNDIRVSRDETTIIIDNGQ